MFWVIKILLKIESDTGWRFWKKEIRYSSQTIRVFTLHRRDLGRCIKIWGIVSFPSFLLLRCFPFAKVVTKAVGGLHRNSSGTYPCQKLCLNSLSSTYIYKEIADIWMTVSIKCQAQGKNWSLCKKKHKIYYSHKQWV